MKKFDIVNPKKYTTKQGEEKTFWANIGTITQFDDGKMIVELHQSQGTFQVFPQKSKEEKAMAGQGQPNAQSMGTPTNAQSMGTPMTEGQNIPF